MESARYSCHVLNKLNCIDRVLKNIRISFQENAPCGSRVVPRGRSDGQSQADMTKLIFAFPNFAKAPETDMS
jgi:hypothetical protein